MPTITPIQSGKFSSRYYADGVEVAGLKELQVKLRTMPTRIANQLQRTAVRKAAHVVANKAKELVPVKTGALRKSIKVKALKRSRRNRGRVGARVVTGKDLFKGDTYYGGMVEFGTKRMRARPFLRSAAQYTQDEVSGVFRAALKRAIRDEETKQAAKALLHRADPVMYAGADY